MTPVSANGWDYAVHVGDRFKHLPSGEIAEIVSIDSKRVVTMRRTNHLTGRPRKPVCVAVADLFGEEVLPGGHRRGFGYVFQSRPAKTPRDASKMRATFSVDASGNITGALCAVSTGLRRNWHYAVVETPEGLCLCDEGPDLRARVGKVEGADVAFAGSGMDRLRMGLPRLFDPPTPTDPDPSEDG